MTPNENRIFAVLRTIIFFSPFAIAVEVVAEADGLEALDSQAATITELQSDNLLESTVRYPASYFSHYDPVTALDMLNRIPGIDSVLTGSGDSRRGLGAGGSAILIDGKRIAGKSNSGTDVLGRIAANQVDHVQIIRGSSADLDVRTAGPIVNVIMNEGASRSSVSAELKAKMYGDSTLRPGGSLSFGGQSGDLDFLASFTAEPYYERQVLKEYSVDGDSSPKGRMLQTRIREQTDYELAGNFGYRFGARDLLQFNALYLDNSAPQKIDRNTTTVASGSEQSSLQREDRRSDRGKWEVGGNYQHSYVGGARFNLTFVVNENIDDWFYDRFDVKTSSVDKSLYIGEDQRNRERIIRASYNTTFAPGQDIELGLEAAQTLLDKSFRLGVADSAGHSPRFGGLRPVSDVRSEVEEIRYEPFAIHNWQISSALALESTLVAEFSEIAQEGVNNGRAVGKAREFEFLKPKLDYRYDASSSTQLRATVERYVSQLSFSNFSASSSNDLDKNVNAGNPDLEQQKSWRYELNVEHRLSDDGGVLSSRIFYHDIEDVIDRVDVSIDPLVWTSAAGNIGDGKRYGAEVDASIRLHALNLREALLTVGALVQDSEVVDPFLNETRRLRGEGRGQLKMGLRHDLPGWNMNYGMDYTYHFMGGEKDVDIDTVQERFRPADASLFLEKVAFGSVTLRLESSNLFDSESCYERTRYLGSTAGGVVEEVEDYCYTYGRNLALKIKTTF